MTVSGLMTRTASKQPAKPTGHGGDQPAVQAAQAWALHLTTKHDEMVAEDEVLGDERGTGRREGEGKVEEEPQEVGAHRRWSRAA